MAAGPKVGVLALQGAFDAHWRALREVGARATLVRSAAEMLQCDALVLPGGESTTMLKLLNEENLKEPLARFAREKPVLATCAGVILLARAVTHPVQESLGILDLTVERNGYGRQIDSRIAQVSLPEGKPFEAVFIRAPVIHSAGEQVTTLAWMEGHPVLVRQGRHLAATFHPELTEDRRIHEMFVSQLRN
jgi:5'-phosphate synthase pdxT subunit